MAQYDPGWVKSFYDQYAEREWQRWDKSPVERCKFAVHLHYLQTYLTADDRILEIGAGAGRFTQELAHIVAQIVAADISPVQLDLNRKNARERGFAGAVERWVECDMCDLAPHFQDAEFDAVVCYGGPLSYVFEQRDRAIGELSRVTKPGGIILLSVMSLWGSAHHALPGVLQVDSAVNSEVLATGDLNPATAAIATQRCHLFRGTELHRFLDRRDCVSRYCLLAIVCLLTGRALCRPFKRTETSGSI
jgi:SAM-dependent methyltransferase